MKYKMDPEFFPVLDVLQDLFAHHVPEGVCENDDSAKEKVTSW